MGLFNRRKQAPMSVGNALCVVDRNGRGWVGQQCHADIPPDTIALLAATTFMIQGARVRALRHLPVAPWLEATRMAASYPDVFNDTMNSRGVTPIGSAVTPIGVRMLGTFSILPTGFLTGEWDPPEPFTQIALASRVFGVLAAAALWCDVEDAVDHVARRLDETAGEIDFTRPHVMAHLPQLMVTYSSRRAARGRTRPLRRREDDPGEPASP
jgi:hypothetical protein